MNKRNLLFMWSTCTVMALLLTSCHHEHDFGVMTYESMGPSELLDIPILKRSTCYLHDNNRWACTRLLKVECDGPLCWGVAEKAYQLGFGSSGRKIGFDNILYTEKIGCETLQAFDKPPSGKHAPIVRCDGIDSYNGTYRHSISKHNGTTK